MNQSKEQNQYKSTQEGEVIEIDVSWPPEGPDKPKNLLLDTVSHEIGTPLSLVYGYLEMLLTREGMSEKQKEQMMQEAWRGTKKLLLVLEKLRKMQGQDFDSLPTKIIGNDKIIDLGLDQEDKGQK